MATTSHAGAGRYWEIDFLRAIAIIMMILFHTLFDISHLGISPVNVSSGIWRMLAYATAGLFIFIVGIALTISYARAVERLPPRAVRLKYLKRGAVTFGYGLVITAVTWAAIGPGFVVFGILHFIGLAVIIAPAFIRFGPYNLFAAASVFLFGVAISGMTGPYWLVWLGIYPPGFFSLDYVPLIPWFSVVLCGIAAGTILYPGGVRGFCLPDLSRTRLAPLLFLGRHSLLVYFIHQPIILGGLWLFFLR